MSYHLSFSWENICVNITEKKGFSGHSTKTKSIINNVSGKVESNSLVAIMGMSGSGKTTLLAAISGQIKDKFGDLKINNTNISDDFLRSVSGYIRQNDCFTETLTVFEHMIFMTSLKLDETKDRRKALTNNLLLELGLEKDIVIKFLSGGQKRKLSLASELICDPYILFCDEITTGLDSYSAISVIEKLEQLSKKGKIVIITVHQPSSQLYQHFSNLILLDSGKLIFQGTKIEAETFFQKQGLICPKSYNPAEFYIKCLTNNENIKTGESNSNINNVDGERFPNLLKDKKFSKSFFYELKWLLWRVWIDTKRNINKYLVSYIILLITATLLSAAYVNVKLEDKNGVQNIQGAVLFAISELIFTHMYYVIFVFPSEVNIFIYEKHLYSSLPYFLSKLISTIPICFINTLSYVTLYFLMLNFLSSFSLFFNMFYFLFLASVAATALGLCLSALFPTIEYIEMFIIPFETLVMILSGIWIKIDTLPKMFTMLKYISPFYLTFESTSVLQWQKIDQLDNCTDVAPPCYENGKEVLLKFGFSTDYDILSYNIVGLHILILTYCVIGYIGIIRKRIVYNFY